MKYNYLKTLTTFIIITALVGFLCTNIIDFTYASNLNEDVDCTIIVHGYQQYTPDGNILDSSTIWAPGMTKKGILQITNDFGKVEINNLGLDVTSINKESAKEDFLNNFRLTVQKIKFSTGSIDIVSTIIDDKTLNQIKDVGVNLGNGSIVTYKSDSTYLKYTLTMDEDSPESLMDIDANVVFSINIAGYEDDPDPPEKKKKKEDKHWAHDCIETLLKHGVIQGYPDGSIKPESNITRAEAAVLVANALKIDPDMLSDYPYEDKSHPWYQGHVTSGSREGVVEGYLDNTFKPSNKITREEMTALLIRGFEKKLSESFALPFADNEAVAAWATEYVMAAVEHNVIEGYPDKTFRPQRNITRAEAFTIICKLLDLHHLHEVTD